MQPGLAVDAAQVEDVLGLRVGAEHLLVVDQAEVALARQQDRRQRVDGEVAVALLEDGADVDHRVGVGARRGEARDRRRVRRQERRTAAGAGVRLVGSSRSAKT